MSYHFTRNWWVAAVFGVATTSLGCGSGAAGGKDGGGDVPTCEDGVDFDGDGYGEGCPAGEDCDDFDSSVHSNCPDANCGTGIYQGCPCDPLTDNPVSCYDGPPGTADNPPCQKGMRSCDPTNSAWGACGGQVLPETEVCDFEDNDCDGDVDEGVQSPCGNCISGCEGTEVGDDPFPLPDDDPNIGGEGVGLDPNGDLILDSSTFENHFIWVANDPEGTVSKIDTRTGYEVARYASVSHEAGVLIDSTIAGMGTVPAWNAGASGNRPSRTAVDYMYDVWVANRAPNAQASITKIINLADECEDRNGNGVIDTSTDVSGNHQIEISNPAEFFAEQDECIQMTVAVGVTTGSNYGARAITIDSGIEPGDPGDPWVGIHGEQALYEIDGRTGARKQRVPPTGTLGIQPYGAAIDSNGLLWAVDTAGSPKLVSVNTQANPATWNGPIPVPGAPGSYGIVVDTENRVWIAGYAGPTVTRYNPADGTAQTVDPFGSGFMSRGLGIDTHGNVWAAAHNPGKTARIDADTVTVTGVWDINGTTPVGVGVDFDGDVWTVNQGTSTASRMHIDQTTLDPAPHPTTGNQVDVFPTGPSPYTYSDFTGLGLRTVTRPLGDYIVPIEACDTDEQAYWIAVEWDATTPPSTSVEIWVRSGDDLATLNSQPIYGPWTSSPADLQAPPGPVPDGHYLQLNIRLKSEDGESTPIVHSYSVQWACPGEPIP